MIRARDFKNNIKDTRIEKLYQLKGCEKFLNLREACIGFVYLLDKERTEKGGYSIPNFFKLASRIEREFLRGEKLEPVLSDNSVIIKVIWSSKYLDDITIINIKADSSCFYNLRHLYTDLLLTQRNERLLKEYGNYTLRAVLGKNEHGVEIWDLEVIDFEPLEVESD